MDSFTQQVIISIVFIGVGFLLRRIGVLKADDGKVLIKIIMNVTLPALIITSLSAVKIDSSLAKFTVVSFLYNITLCLIGVLLFRKQMGGKKVNLIILVPGMSLALFTMPLLAGVENSTALGSVAMMDIGNSIVSLFIVYIVGSCYSKQASSFRQILKSVLQSMPIMAYLITITIKLAGFNYPQFFLNITGVAAESNIFICFIMLGVIMNIKFRKEELLDIVWLLLIRYGFGIAAGLVISEILRLEAIMKFVLVAGFVAPLSISAVAYTERFKLNTEFASSYANITILFSIVIYVILFRTLVY